MPSVKNSDRPDVLIVDTATLDGVAEIGDAQVIALATKTSGTNAAAGLETVGIDNPLPAIDATPPLLQLAAGGAELTPGVVVNLLAATPGRLKTLIQHTGDAGKVWIRFDGTPAAAGIGECIFPGQQWSEWTDAAISVVYEGAGTCQVATSELTA